MFILSKTLPLCKISKIYIYIVHSVYFVKKLEKEKDMHSFQSKQIFTLDARTK